MSKLKFVLIGVVSVGLGACAPNRSSNAPEDRSQVPINHTVQRDANTGANGTSTSGNQPPTAGGSTVLVPLRFLSTNPLINQLTDKRLADRLSLVWDWLGAQHQTLALRHMENALGWWVRLQQPAAAVVKPLTGNETESELNQRTITIEYQNSKTQAEAVVKQMLADRDARLSGAVRDRAALSKDQIETVQKRFEFFLFMFKIGDLDKFLTENIDKIPEAQRAEVIELIQRLELTIVARLALAESLDDLSNVDADMKRSMNEARIRLNMDRLPLDAYNRPQ